MLDAVDHCRAKEEADVIQRGRGDDEALRAVPDDPRIWTQICLWVLRGGWRRQNAYEGDLLRVC